MKSLLEAAKSDDDDEKIGENDEAKKEFEDIVVDVSSTKVMILFITSVFIFIFICFLSKVLSQTYFKKDSNKEID